MWSTSKQLRETLRRENRWTGLTGVEKHISSKQVQEETIRKSHRKIRPEVKYINEKRAGVQVESSEQLMN